MTKQFSCLKGGRFDYAMCPAIKLEGPFTRGANIGSVNPRRERCRTKTNIPGKDGLTRQAATMRQGKGAVTNKTTKQSTNRGFAVPVAR